MRVALIPTGKLELCGLAGALERAFPGHEFACRPLIPGDKPAPFRSFTSAELPLASLHDPSSSLSELVDAMIDALREDEDNDLVLVLDDLELFNEGKAGVVCDEFRAAVHRRLARLAARGDLRPSHLVKDLRQRLQERASFHLAVPMIESWLFADAGGPANAGVPEDRCPPRLLMGCDPEAFATDDPSYSGDRGESCTKYNALSARNRRQTPPEWLKEGPHKRERHPKRYMAWLCRDPEARQCTTYDDPAGGRALAALDWRSVLEPRTQMKFARALIADLAAGLGTPPVGFSLAGEQAEATSICTTRSSPVLRNL